MKQSTYRAGIAILLMLLITAAMLTGCNSNSNQPAPSVSSQPSETVVPLKIGVLSELTGSASSSAPALKNGFEFYLETHDNKLGGRPVTLIIEDIATDPATTLTKAKKLVEQDGVDMIVGPVNAACAYAILEYIAEKQIPMFVGGMGAATTQMLKSDTVFRLTAATTQIAVPLAEYAYDKLGYRNIAMYSADFAFGYENSGAFQTRFEELGGRITHKIWTAMGTNDHGTYISQIPLDVDAVFAVQVGVDGINFFNDYSSFGIPLPVIGPSIIEEPNIPSILDAAEGAIVSACWSPYLDRPEITALRETFKEKYGVDPSYVGGGGYDAGIIIDSIINAIGDDFRNPEIFSSTIKSMVFHSVSGDFKYDDYNNPTRDIFIMEYRNVDGNFGNHIIDVYKGYDQFGGKDPETTIALTASFSKDFPPLTP